MSIIIHHPDIARNTGVQKRNKSHLNGVCISIQSCILSKNQILKKTLVIYKSNLHLNLMFVHVTQHAIIITQEYPHREFVETSIVDTEIRLLIAG